jgi:hypothetical protein
MLKNCAVATFKKKRNPVSKYFEIKWRKKHKNGFSDQLRGKS